MKKISVIVPIFNIEKYVAQCIESILKQTYKNIEIILVDDGSTDSSGVICDRYSEKDSRIIVIHKKNENLSRARKTGLDISTGDYIAFVDGDDWIEPNMFELLLNKAIQTDADFVESGFIEDYGHKKIFRSVKEGTWNINDNLRNQFLENWIFNFWDAEVRSQIWSKLYKADIIKKSYENVSCDYGEDILNYVYLLHFSSKVCVTNYCGYHYITRNDSLSHHLGNDILCRNIDAANIIYKTMAENYTLINKKIIDSWYFNQLLFEIERIKSNDKWSIQSCLFPCVERLINKRIIIYGAGLVGRNYYLQLSKYNNIEIVAWVDKNPLRYKYEYCDVLNIADITKFDYEYVLIAVSDEHVANEIQSNLRSMGISESSIIWEKPLNQISNAKLELKLTAKKTNC